MSVEQAFKGDLYAGLTGLNLSDDPIELGEGIVLKKTSARFLMPLTLQNTGDLKTPTGKIRPAYWQFSSVSNDIGAELVIPANLLPTFAQRFELVRVIVFLIRLWSNPAITLHVLSDHPFALLTEIEDGHQPRVLPLETFPRHFSLGLVNESQVVSSLDWVTENWKVAHSLYTTSSEFKLAADAIDSGQFVPNTALTMVSLWGALEAIFSPSTTELRFRVSALIAAYLQPLGSRRLEQQKEIASLYDKRSAAAHGKPKHESEDLLRTFELLRKVLIKVIRHKKVPTKDELDMCLFGGAF